MTRNVSITDVARAARVSTTTVSRVINDVPTVSDANRERVVKAIHALRYQPNPSAQHLAAGKTNTIGLVIPRYEGIFHSYYALEVIKGIGMAAEQARYDLLLHVTDGKTLPKRGAVDGLLFADVYGCEELIDRVVDDGMSTLVLNHYFEELPVNCVAVDNRSAAALVVDYLVRLGHREIATITGDLKVQAALDRLDGFVQAMKARQLPVPPDSIQYGDFGLPSARRATEALLELSKPPTAVFVASDDMALEAIQAAQAKGVRVPEELSVVGFDDNPIAAHARVPLTTVRQPLAEMGRQGLETLHQYLTGKKKNPTKLLLSTELIERRSCRQTWLDR